jgi:hypothetical protein
MGEDIFLDSGIEEYNCDIFLGTEEFKKPEEHMIFFCSGRDEEYNCDIFLGTENNR